VDLGLKDATAVVVGGGRGMGLAAARCLADDGARVGLVGRTRAVLDSATADLSLRGSPDAVAFVADAEDEQQVRRVFEEISDRWGGELNILINTVGPGVQGSFEQLGDDQWRMQRQSPNLVAYTAAKAMVTSISKNLSQLLAPEEIMVNVVSPGSIASEALVGWAGSVGVDGSDPYALMTAIDKHFGHPAYVPRAGLPDEIGSVVAFLPSRRNSYMTGANINVDGGSDFT
jgi:NAD(P)-dependent dehydrogenase (short-subunit alcohol dehydrogenase family)